MLAPLHEASRPDHDLDLGDPAETLPPHGGLLVHVPAPPRDPLGGQAVEVRVRAVAEPEAAPTEQRAFAEMGIDVSSISFSI